MRAFVCFSSCPYVFAWGQWGHWGHRINSGLPCPHSLALTGDTGDTKTNKTNNKSQLKTETFSFLALCPPWWALACTPCMALPIVSSSVRDALEYYRHDCTSYSAKRNPPRPLIGGQPCRVDSSKGQRSRAKIAGLIR